MRVSLPFSLSSSSRHFFGFLSQLSGLWAINKRLYEIQITLQSTWQASCWLMCLQWTTRKPASSSTEHLSLSIFTRLTMRPTARVNNDKEPRDINHNSAIVFRGVKAVKTRPRATQLRIDFIRKKFSWTCGSPDNETRTTLRIISHFHSPSLSRREQQTSDSKTSCDLNSQASRTVK